MIVCESGLPLIGAAAKRGNGPLRGGSVTRPSSVALVFDWLDDGDRLTAFGEDHFLARADGLDSFREVLVGFAQSELHVVMLLHFLR